MPGTCFRLWKIGETEIESTETDYFKADIEKSGWKCTSLNDQGHMLLVQNDGTPFLEHLIFDENGIDTKLGFSELKSRDRTHACARDVR